VSTVLLASNTIKPEVTFDEEYSSDTEDSIVDRIVHSKYLALSNQVAEFRELRTR